MEGASATNHCFGCGRDNPIGLKLDMHMEDGRCVAYFTPKAEHESYGDRMHGGLTSTLLDEVMDFDKIAVTYRQLRKRMEAGTISKDILGQ